MNFVPDTNLAAWFPILMVLFTAVVANLLGLFLSKRDTGIVTLVGFVVALAATFAMWGSNRTAFAGALSGDNFSLGFNIAILLGAIFTVLSSLDTVPQRRDRLGQPEFYALVAYAVTGAMILCASRDLVVMLIGFEIMSLAVYVLAAFADREQSEEAGMKYFLLGSLASAILIYGIVLIFGATGSFDLAGIQNAASAVTFKNKAMLALGSVMVLVGFGFKVSWVPFHQWTPDVYSGAPTLVTQFMGVVIKSAAFAGLLRICGEALPKVDAWQPVAQFLIALTLLVGNLAALRQTNLKRMLAYSSVAQAGYIGLAVLANPGDAWPAAIFYLVVYTCMTAAAFMALQILGGDAGVELKTLHGISGREPIVALALSLALVALAGIPPLAGFFGKLFVFQVAANQGLWGLVTVAALASVLSFYYYLKPVYLMYFKPTDAGTVRPRQMPLTRVGLVVAVLLVVVLGVVPAVLSGPLESVGKIVQAP